MVRRERERVCDGKDRVCVRGDMHAKIITMVQYILKILARTYATLLGLDCCSNVFLCSPVIFCQRSCHFLSSQGSLFWGEGSRRLCYFARICKCVDILVKREECTMQHCLFCVVVDNVHVHVHVSGGEIWMDMEPTTTNSRLSFFFYSTFSIF